MAAWTSRPRRPSVSVAMATYQGETYLPRQLTADELRPQMEAAIGELGASSMADMGKIMPKLMQQFKGSADGRVISQLAREILSQAK